MFDKSNLKSAYCHVFAQTAFQYLVYVAHLCTSTGSNLSNTYCNQHDSWSLRNHILQRLSCLNFVFYVSIKLSVSHTFRWRLCDLINITRNICCTVFSFTDSMKWRIMIDGIRKFAFMKQLRVNFQFLFLTVLIKTESLWRVFAILVWNHVCKTAAGHL